MKECKIGRVSSDDKATRCWQAIQDFRNELEKLPGEIEQESSEFLMRYCALQDDPSVCDGMNQGPAEVPLG